MKHQFFLFPLAVSHGRRHKDFCTGAKKGSYYAQTSVASTMETVQSKCFDVMFVASFLKTIIAEAQKGSLQYLIGNDILLWLCLSGHQWPSWLGQIYSSGAWKPVVCDWISRQNNKGDLCDFRLGLHD